MAQIKVRRTKWDETLSQPLPPDIDELVARLSKIEKRQAAEREPAQH